MATGSHGLHTKAGDVIYQRLPHTLLEPLIDTGNAKEKRRGKAVDRLLLGLPLLWMLALVVSLPSLLNIFFVFVLNIFSCDQVAATLLGAPGRTSRSFTTPPAR